MIILSNNLMFLIHTLLLICICGKWRRFWCGKTWIRISEFWEMIKKKAKSLLCPKLRRNWGGHIAFWPYVRPCVRASATLFMHAMSYEPCILVFWNFIYWFLVKTIADKYFYLIWVISISGVMPLWKKNQNEIFLARHPKKCLSKL